jgi:S1-C subfamily serine protease
MDPIVQQLNDAMSGVIGKVCESLVRISNDRGGEGAGTIWHADGLIVTNAHVIAGHNQLYVTLQSGERYPAQVLAQDPERDLAALSIPVTDLPAVEVGDSRAIKPGQWVMSLGHPLGVTNGATGGIVIAAGQRLGDMHFRNGQDWLAVNLKLRPGHSGGPLFDTQGRLLGVNTIMNGLSVGVAIPVHVVKAFLDEARSTRREAVCSLPRQSVGARFPTVIVVPLQDILT